MRGGCGMHPSLYQASAGELGSAAGCPAKRRKSLEASGEAQARALRVATPSRSTSCKR